MPNETRVAELMESLPEPRRLLRLVKGRAVPVQAAQHAPALTGLRVLIVEDDTMSARRLSALLASAGANVRIARSAEDAMSTLRAFEIDVVVVDLVLPRMSGLLFVRQCRAHVSMQRMLFIGVSGLDGPQTERLALESGCAAYFRKPIEGPAYGRLVAHLDGARARSSGPAGWPERSQGGSGV